MVDKEQCKDTIKFNFDENQKWKISFFGHKINRIGALQDSANVDHDATIGTDCMYNWILDIDNGGILH